ncbi:MAG TPA: HAD family hydrolase [Spirochaetia bacterium]|nr:HAD family hydrolase [Spirochaetia bacterium]
MTYKAVLFDLDGTLLDTLEDLADSMNAVLSSRGYPTHPMAEYRYFVGDGVEMLVRRAVPDGLGSEEQVVRACMEQMRDEYARRWQAKSRPYPGIPELLDGLTEKGILLTILSNKPNAFVQQIALHFFGKWRFATAQGAVPDVPRKPDPAGALAISRTIGVPPASFLYLGDTNTDMETANAAGMYPVGVLWGFRPEEELRGAGARFLAARPEDVLALV